MSDFRLPDQVVYAEPETGSLGASASVGGTLGSFLGPAGALLGAGVGLIGDLVGLGQQRRLQRRQWEREDTAVQRRVADLRAAGLSPTLAAGSAAGSSAPINVMGQISSAGDRASAAVEGAFELSAKRTLLRKLDAEAGRSEADRKRADADAAIAAARVPYAQHLARWESMAGSNRAWLLNSERMIAETRREIIETTGLDQARADLLARNLQNRIAGYAQEWTERSGTGPVTGVRGWVGLVKDVLSVFNGRSFP